MTKNELMEFCADFLEGRLFTSEHVQPAHLIPVVFRTAKQLLGEDPQYLEKVGLIWERLDEASEQMVNGFPQFRTHLTMHIVDWNRCREVIERCRKNRAADLEAEFEQ